MEKELKANAPEKIYRTTTYLENDKGKTLWKTNPVAGAENIEYTRTDAFIEKTEKFMNTVNEYLYHCVSEECDYVDTDKFIEEFRKYIKG